MCLCVQEACIRLVPFVNAYMHYFTWALGLLTLLSVGQKEKERMVSSS